MKLDVGSRRTSVKRASVHEAIAQLPPKHSGDTAVGNKRKSLTYALYSANLNLPKITIGCVSRPCVCACAPPRLPPVVTVCIRCAVAQRRCARQADDKVRR